jgi:AraC-like DNA-binding protein
LEAGLARALGAVHPRHGQRDAHSQRPGSQERHERRNLDRGPAGPRPDPRQLRATGADPRTSRSDTHAEQLVGEIARHTLRIQKTLEDANVKLTQVVSDILGASGRAILKALIAGETDPARLADLTTGRLKASRPQLMAALHGRVTAHHRFMIELHLVAFAVGYDSPAAFGRTFRKRTGSSPITWQRTH